MHSPVLEEIPKSSQRGKSGGADPCGALWRSERMAAGRSVGQRYEL